MIREARERIFLASLSLGACFAKPVKRIASPSCDDTVTMMMSIQSSPNARTARQRLIGAAD